VRNPQGNVFVCLCIGTEPAQQIPNRSAAFSRRRTAIVTAVGRRCNSQPLWIPQFPRCRSARRHQWFCGLLTEPSPCPGLPSAPETRMQPCKHGWRSPWLHHGNPLATRCWTDSTGAKPAYLLAAFLILNRSVAATRRRWSSSVSATSSGTSTGRPVASRATKVR